MPDPTSGEETGSPGSASPSKQENSVPLERAEQMATRAAQNVRDEMTATMQHMQTKIEGLESKAASPPQRDYTRQELQGHVDNGALTEEAMEGMLDEQRQRKAVATVTKEVRGELDKRDRDASVKAAIGQYTSHVDGLMTEGSEARNKVTSEFHSLVSELGMDKSDLKTELLALRNVFGPSAGLHNRGARLTETHEETGGNEDIGGGSSNNKDGSPKGMSDRERRHYQEQIDKGRYSDWAAVGKDLGFANEAVRRRHGARV